MIYRRVFLLSLPAAFLAPAGPACAGLMPLTDSMLLASAERDLGLKHIKLKDMNFAAAEKIAAGVQPAEMGAGKKPGRAAAPLKLQEDEDKTSLDISFGDDDDKKVDGGIDKLSSPAAVGLEHKLSDNLRVGGAALFDGRGRGAAARLGFTW